MPPKSGLKPTKTEMMPGYRIQVKGQYYTKEKKFKMYDMTFFVPREVEVQVRREWKWFKVGKKAKIRRSVPVFDKVNGRENAQYIIQRLMLPHTLTERYPDAAHVNAVRTCRIVEVKKAEEPAEKHDFAKKKPAVMNRAELARFCLLHDLDVPHDSFSDIEDARAAVQEAFDEKTLDKPGEEVDPDADLEDESPDRDPDAGAGDGEKVEDDEDLLS